MVWTAYGGWVIRGAGFLHASKANLHNTHYFCQQCYNCNEYRNWDLCVYVSISLHVEVDMHDLQFWLWPSPEAWHPSSSSQSVLLPSSVSPLPSSSHASIWPSFGNLSWVSYTKKNIVKQVYYTPFRYNLHFTMSSLPTNTLLANS